jgi:hypothetical protein
MKIVCQTSPKYFLSNQTKFTSLQSHCQPQWLHLSSMMCMRATIHTSLEELDQRIPFEKLYHHVDGVAHKARAPPLAVGLSHESP